MAARREANFAEAMESALHSKPGLNFRFANRRLSVLLLAAIQNENSGSFLFTLLIADLRKRLWRDQPLGDESK